MFSAIECHNKEYLSVHLGLQNTSHRGLKQSSYLVRGVKNILRMLLQLEKALMKTSTGPATLLRSIMTWPSLNFVTADVHQCQNCRTLVITQHGT